MAEYEGLIAGLRAAMGLGIRRLLVNGDSQLVVNQVSKEYQCADPQMAAYMAAIRKLEKRFDGLELRYIPRRDNALADDLSRLASSRACVPAGVFEERLTLPSVLPAEQDEGETSSLIQVTPATPSVGSPDRVPPSDECAALADCSQNASWMAKIRGYLKEKFLPEDDASAERVARQSKRYAIVDGDLYRRSAGGILLICITRAEGGELLAEIHEGECGGHALFLTLVGKAFWQGFYWPTALQDAFELVRRCRACQFHAKQIHQPAQDLQTIPLSWPFAV